MNTETYLQQTNEAYKQAQQEGFDLSEFTRQWLLDLNQADIKPEEKAKCIRCLAPVKPWKAVQQTIYEEYMIDIGEEESPFTQPCYGCWLDLEQHTISTRRQDDLFAGTGVAVWLPDYRVINENIKWQDIAQEGENK